MKAETKCHMLRSDRGERLHQNRKSRLRRLDNIGQTPKAFLENPRWKETYGSEKFRSVGVT